MNEGDVKVSKIGPFSKKRKIETSFEKLTSSFLLARIGAGATGIFKCNPGSHYKMREILQNLKTDM